MYYPFSAYRAEHDRCSSLSELLSALEVELANAKADGAKWQAHVSLMADKRASALALHKELARTPR